MVCVCSATSANSGRSSNTHQKPCSVGSSTVLFRDLCMLLSCNGLLTYYICAVLARTLTRARCPQLVLQMTGCWLDPMRVRV